MNPSLKRSLWCRWFRKERFKPYSPPEGSYEFVACARCGGRIEAASEWKRDGPVFYCERCAGGV